MVQVKMSDFNAFLDYLSIFNDFWFEFHRAAIKYKEDSQSPGLKSFLRLCDSNPYDYIVAAFVWDNTERGSCFWRTINTLWQERLNGLESKTDSNRE